MIPWKLRIVSLAQQPQNFASISLKTYFMCYCSYFSSRLVLPRQQFKQCAFNKNREGLGYWNVTSPSNPFLTQLTWARAFYSSPKSALCSFRHPTLWKEPKVFFVLSDPNLLKSICNLKRNGIININKTCWNHIKIISISLFYLTLWSLQSYFS